MVDERFVSHAQNREDVVLWRALGSIPNGRYLDVGAGDPVRPSISRAFYDRGWRGIVVEPNQRFVQLHRQLRLGDTVVNAAITSRSTGTATLHEHIHGGLSTLLDGIRDRHTQAGFEFIDVEVPAQTLDAILAEQMWQDLDIHFMSVAVEGSEADALASIDLARWRPWVLVVRSTAPLTTEPTQAAWESGIFDANYEFCLFDGLSRYYVAAEFADRLRPTLTFPACSLDEFQTIDERELLKDVARWRGIALTSWAQGLEGYDALTAHVKHLASELYATKQTVSWRVTTPLRAVRRRRLGGPSAR